LYVTHLILELAHGLSLNPRDIKCGQFPARGSHAPKMPTAKPASDDKEVVMTEGLDKVENDLVMALAPVTRDEPIVTRRELWSYYSMSSHRPSEGCRLSL